MYYTLYMRLLFVEDEKGIVVPLKRSLEKEQFAVDVAMDGKSGLALARIHSYDCLILDINLPEMNGLDIARLLRADGNTTPILFLTARGQLEHTLEGFASGADDYMVKPFHIEELVARVRSLIKRQSPNQAQLLQFGKATLFPEKNQVVYTNGQSVDLTTKETAILEYLLRNNNRIVSTEELLEHVWDREVNIFTDTVKTHMKTLRHKIDPDKQIITTVRGKGYTIRL